MRGRTLVSLLLVFTLLLSPGAALASSPASQPIEDHAIDLASIPTPPGLSYDYTEPIENPGQIETEVIFCETYSVPKMVTIEEGSISSTRPIYGQRILQTTIPGTTIYWGHWNGLYQAIQSTVIHVVSLAIESTVKAYLFAVITGFSPQPTSQVGIEIGYAYNTYKKEAQIQSTSGGPWETYYTAYKYDYFRYDRTTVTNPEGINPPLQQYIDNPTDVPDRVGISPNFNNDGEISTRGTLLFENYCPAGWEDENTVYYPLDYAR